MIGSGPYDPSLNKYSLVKGAARRARQLQSGAPPLGVSKSTKACKVAQDEIRFGKVTFTLTGKRPPAPPASM
jgi:DNA-directed RNA polymerase subunit omega